MNNDTIRDNIRTVSNIAQSLGWNTRSDRYSPLLHISSCKPVGHELEIIESCDFSILCKGRMTDIVRYMEEEMEQFVPEEQTRLWFTKTEHLKWQDRTKTITKEFTLVKAALNDLLSELRFFSKTSRECSIFKMNNEYFDEVKEDSETRISLRKGCYEILAEKIEDTWLIDINNDEYQVKKNMKNCNADDVRSEIYRQMIRIEREYNQ